MEEVFYGILILLRSILAKKIWRSCPCSVSVPRQSHRGQGALECGGTQSL